MQGKGSLAENFVSIKTLEGSDDGGFAVVQRRAKPGGHREVDTSSGLGRVGGTRGGEGRRAARSTIDGSGSVQSAAQDGSGAGAVFRRVSRERNRRFWGG